MDEEEQISTKRKSRLAANFAKVKSIEQPLKAAHITMPAGCEGEIFASGTKFYCNANDPRLDGTSK